MGGGLFQKLARGKKAVALYLMLVFLLSSFGDGLVRNTTPIAEAAQVSIDTTARTTGVNHIHSGSQSVFIDDQTGYKFYVDAGGYCVYEKTTNGGISWSSTTTVDSQTDCIAISVWYDRWTPGNTGTLIHIVTMDTSLSDLWYNNLDTNGDSLLKGSTPVDAVTNSGNSIATFVAGANYPSITESTDGTIYVAAEDTTDGYVVKCSTSCGLTTGWTEAGTNPFTLANDYAILVPLTNGDIMKIERIVGLEDLVSKVWHNGTSAWDAANVTIDANATDNTTYDVGMAAAVSSTTGDIYFAYIANNATLGTDDQVRGAKYVNGVWATTTSILTGTTLGLTSVAIGLDATDDNVYVAYSGRTTAATASTGNVYWKTATSSMANWSVATGPVNSVANDIYGVDLNMASDQRLFVSWFGVTGATIFGDTIADIFPGIHASTSGSQITSTYASTSNVSIGGAFALSENYKTQNVNAITITQTGTINAATELSNVKLFYKMDTTVPYDCVSESYTGTESQFGSTAVSGFSGPQGIAAFSGSSVAVSTTSTMCVFPVMTVNDSAQSSSTINITIDNPTTDITVSDGSLAGPSTIQDSTGSTLVYNDTPTLVHYHWRNDNGGEATATSMTGGVQDTQLATMKQGSSTRLRVEVTNGGSSSTPAMQYRLEYAQTSGVCSAATGWTVVGSTGAEINMYNSPYLTDGANTTNIAVATGGVTDANTTFLTPNGGVKKSSAQTGNIVLSTSQFVELEYAIVASTTAIQGNSYCFRVTDQGNPIPLYSIYPQATIGSDVAVSVATSSQIATTSIPATNTYIGGAFVIKNNSAAHTVTSITIAENATVDAQNGLSNIRLKYKMDTTAPYNCADQSYIGTEAQFGATSTGGFSGADGTSTFAGSVTITSTSTMCVYVVLNVATAAHNGDIVNITIDSPATDVIISGGGTVGPSTLLDLVSSTTLLGAILTQNHYHWRNDDGSETTATSMTGGVQDTAVTYVSQSTPVRLRLEVTNAGVVTSGATPYRLEYGAKISTCSAVATWTDVGAFGGGWDMYASPNLTDGADTTNITIPQGGVTDGNTTFLTPNSAVKDASSSVATTTLTATQFLETEFAMKQTINAPYNTTYCFRLSENGQSLDSYTTYPELTTAPKRDFKIQRGTLTITSTSTTIIAGTDYTAPSASSSAFIRITNLANTGGGHNTGATTAQTAANMTVSIVNPSDIMSSVTFARTGITNNTRVSWEIIEYIGPPGGDNEMIVRSQSTVTYGTTALVATGTTASNVSNNAQVVVFITGQANPLANSTAYNTGLSTSDWNITNMQPVFTRNSQSTNAVAVSYAVVEFKGLNWLIQRSEHTYTAAGTTETEPINALNSLSHTFIHSQQRIGTGFNTGAYFGSQIWLSSVGYVSFFLDANAVTPSGVTSVAWIIENTQVTSGEMTVSRSNGSTNGGTAPLTVSVPIGITLSDLTNASLFVNASLANTATTFPRALAGATIASSTAYELWRANTTGILSYRAEVVEWPAAGLAIKQNYYRLYVDNNALKPTDPWPVGAADLGENTVLTGSDEPLGQGERIRIRISLTADNATFPEQTEAFRLQYAPLTTTCSAITESNWTSLGDGASSTVWRGYNATGTTDGTNLSGNPPTVGDLLLSVSSIAGTFEDVNDTGVNPYSVPAGQDVEYDWLVEQNGATPQTYYCFRMVQANGVPLDGYNQYPQILTATFTPRSQNWRWYSDIADETPTTTLASENVAPINIANSQGLKLRVTVKEIKNMGHDDIRFKLQYSEYADFSSVYDVVATSTCTATSTWCYTVGAGVDNAVITTKTLSDANSCVASVGNGCGTHNISPNYITGFRQKASTATEYEFTITPAAPRVNDVYYFRLFDLGQGIPVPKNTTNSYPSLVTQGASLTFGMASVASSTTIAGVTTNINTMPSLLNFGTIPINTNMIGAHQLSVDTNGTEGYQVFMTMSGGNLKNYKGATIQGVSGTNAAPTAWSIGCSATSTSCLGYHTTDATLQGGSVRFAANDTYASLSTTTLDEVAFSSQPTISEITDVVFRVLIRQLQDAGQYKTTIQYISVPVF